MTNMRFQYVMAKQGFTPPKVQVYSKQSGTLHLLKSLCLTLPLLIGISGAWGQEIENGFYYIENKQNSSEYYLCPSIGGYFHNEEQTPSLTTFQTGKRNSSIWRIEKVSIPDDEQDYYHFIHVASGKYLTIHEDVVDADNPVRLRLHLEAFESPTDAPLFVIEENSSHGQIAIRHQRISATNTDKNVYWWLDISSNNQDNYWDGTFKGALGLWYVKDHKLSDRAKWKLLPVTIAMPDITYSARRQSFSINYPIAGEGVTIYYTTDGSEPTQSSGKRYTGEFTSNGASAVRAIAVNSDGAVSAIADYLIGRQVYIQSVQDKNFYVIPGDVSGGFTMVNTTSLLRPSAEWRLLDASLVNGSQYYYIVNNLTGDYLYKNTANSNANMMPASSFDEADNNYKFIVTPYDVADYSQGYRISSKAQPANSLNKGGNPPHGAGDNLTTNGNRKNAQARWNILVKKPLMPNPPFKISTIGDAHYYQIANVASTSFVISPSTNVTTTNSSTAANTHWYFQKADSDEWLDYYYIINAQTGQYMYFNLNNISTNQANAFVMMNAPTGPSDRFLFALAPSAYEGQWFIVPKNLRYLLNTNFTAISRENASLYTNSSRGDNKMKWTFTETTTFKCQAPTFSYDETTGLMAINSPSAGADIYYSINTAGEPAISTETHYTGPFQLPANIVRAIAARSLDGSDKSALATSSEISAFKCAKPTVSYDEISGLVTISCATPNASIYYTVNVEGEPALGETTHYTESFPVPDGSTTTVRAIAALDAEGSGKSEMATSEEFPKFKCAPPVITFSSSEKKIVITCASAGATVYYTTNGNEPTVESTEYIAPFTASENATIKAIAIRNRATSNQSDVAAYSGIPVIISSWGNTYSLSGSYILADDFTPPSYSIGTEDAPFTGTIDGGFCTITLSCPLIGYAKDAIIKNITVESSSDFSASGNAGAIAATAVGATRIYNCGVLKGTISGGGHVGSIVGEINGNVRVINCYSFATVKGGTTGSGIVGYNSTEKVHTKELNKRNIDVAITQNTVGTKAMVMNCMFYGDITSGAKVYPVYGGPVIRNDDTEDGGAVNGYNYYRLNRYDQETGEYVDDVTFDNGYTHINDYNLSWPAEDKYLTRFEYYRSILNSNRRLCTWWVNGAVGVAPTDEDVENVGIAKWVLDPTIAPYPILKPWGKYPSIINPDPEWTWDGRTKDADGNALTPHKVNRTSAPDYLGKNLGELNVTVSPGTYATNAETKYLRLVITDMDTINHDFSYYKVQLPYYNELYGNPEQTDHLKRYGGNYTDHVVTGWKVTAVTGGTYGSFAEDWEAGFNFADRNCTAKDLYSVSKRVFAQGGFFYVPEGVTGIAIEAYWGKAAYLHNTDHSIDRVNVTSGGGHGAKFTPAGTLPETFYGQTVYTSLRAAIQSLDAGTSLSVYDQAVVLLGNYQKRNGNDVVDNSNGWRPFTIMSADLDFDNEPDFCMQWQFREGTNRPSILPIRFDFLPVPELGLAIRHNSLAYSLGIFVPQGHFEITETAFMHTSQFEYDSNNTRMESQSPLILNGGHFEQIVLRYGNKDRTSYILMGGHFWLKRFTPGYHAGPDGSAVRHCAVNAIGGEYPEFYLSGIYSPDKAVRADNPHCYTNGGRFELMAGSGYEQVNGNVTFKIDHSVIDEFYGGGISSSKPVTGSIDVTIDHSLVGKYCGGPKVGAMGAGKTVTTRATGSIFREFFGGGNGGTSYYRAKLTDGTGSFPKEQASSWTGFGTFNPLNMVSGLTKAYDDGADKKGYHGEYEFEIFNSSNGLKSDEDVIRAYLRWAQFGVTATGDVASTLTDCTVKGDFYGGGNLANVTGNVSTTLTNTHVQKSVFAAGFSASIPSFPAHNKESVRFPHRDVSGTITEYGSLDYVKNDDGTDRHYTWCYKNPTTGEVSPAGVVIPAGVDTDNPTFQYGDEWYCYTTISLENLGTVSGNASITINGGTIGGSVYGGGDESKTGGSTTVTIKGGSQIAGDVFGGGNNGDVGGSTTVNIEN